MRHLPLLVPGTLNNSLSHNVLKLDACLRVIPFSLKQSHQPLLFLALNLALQGIPMEEKHGKSLAKRVRGSQEENQFDGTGTACRIERRRGEGVGRRASVELGIVGSGGVI